MWCAALALLQGCVAPAQADSAPRPVAIALWTVPSQVRAGTEFWLQVRVEPGITLTNARLSLDAQPEAFRFLGPSVFELGTIARPQTPPPSKPPALPFTYVYAFHLLALQPGAVRMDVALTSSGDAQHATHTLEVLP